MGSRHLHHTASLAALATLVASPALAGDVQMSTKWNGQDAAGAGGPFTATLLPDGNPFITYCVEGNEYFNNGQYWKEIATSAKAGGYQGPDPDPLSSGSAWLYRQVHDAVMSGKTNALTNLTWNDNGVKTFDATSISDLSEIQRVIWNFEGESQAGGALNSARFNAIVSLVSSTVGANYLDQGELYGVRVLRLWTNQDLTGNAQDQLIVIPMPVAAGMATVGLFGLGVIRRRRD